VGWGEGSASGNGRGVPSDATITALSFLFSVFREITDNTAHAIFFWIICGKTAFATGNIITG
jgi:hypothetical protein